MTQDSGVGQVTPFMNDDQGYLRWLDAHPGGFVLNCDKTPKKTYLVLHRATCGHLSTAERSNWTTGNYIKICSDSIAAIQAWVSSRVDGGVLDPCSVCKPE